MFFGNGSTVTLANVSFSFNDVAGTGGGLVVGSSASLSMRSASFVSNSAGASAGALAVGAGSRAVAERCEFISNAVSLGAGGAIALFGGAALTIADSLATANDAFLGGFLAFDEVSAAASSSAVQLRGLVLGGNTATAGSLYGTLEGSKAFQARRTTDPPPPSCGIRAAGSDRTRHSGLCCVEKM